MNIEHDPEEYHQNVDKGTYAERAFQRAIIALKSAIINDDEISWIDIELPIKEGKTDRFDLIGETSEGNYILCELKFAQGTTNGDSPEKATTQVLQYKNTLIDYATRLKAAGQNFNLHLNATYKQLDITFDSYKGESFYTDKMPAQVEKLREAGLLKLDDGASIVDLSEYKMPPCLILKKDGSTLYPTRDIAAAVATYRDMSFAELERITDENAERFLNLI